MRILPVLVLALLFFNAAALDGQTAGDQVLANTEWRLVSFGRTGSVSNVIKGTKVTIRFGADGRVNGSSGCNSYSGTYRLRGSDASFGRMISTMRACLDQRANQQEQSYLAALQSASRFRLSSNQLTIFYDLQGQLSFVSDSGTPPSNANQEQESDPVSVISSYYAAINAKDYRKAYAYWEQPATSFEQFSRGFSDTERVRVLVEPPGQIEGAAGSSYADMATIIVARRTGGTERVFTGCYTLRRSNLPVEDGGDVRGWRIYKANLKPVDSGIPLPGWLDQSCKR
jgi:heat shock protein HslJ